MSKICPWCGEVIPAEDIKTGNKKYHSACARIINQLKPTKAGKREVKKRIGISEQGGDFAGMVKCLGPDPGPHSFWSPDRRCVRI